MANRTPPRFVPTLTEVVAGPRAAAGAAGQAGSRRSGSTTRR